MRTSRIAAALIASALTLSLAGCFGNPLESLVEGAIENQTGIDVDASATGESVALPEGWPDLPVPAGTITSAISADTTFALTIVVDSEAAIESVTSQLLAAGYTESSRTDLGELEAVVLVSPEWTIGITWTLDPETQKIYVTYGASETQG